MNNSKYSELFGIPVAFLGTAAYLAIPMILLLDRSNTFFRNYSTLAIFGISLAGTLFSAYLTYLELFVIHAICPFCVVSAVVMLTVLTLTSVRLFRSEL